MQIIVRLVLVMSSVVAIVVLVEMSLQELFMEMVKGRSVCKWDFK